MKISIIILQKETPIPTIIEKLQTLNTFGLDVEYFIAAQTGTYSAIRNILIQSYPATKQYGYAIKSIASVATGYYIGWMHDSIDLDILETCFEYIANHPTSGYFIKGLRTNRSTLNKLFTWAHGKIASIMFYSKFRDINAHPVLFPANIVKSSATMSMPDDETIELFVYEESLSSGLHEERINIRVQNEKQKTFKQKIHDAHEMYKKMKALKAGGNVR